MPNWVAQDLYVGGPRSQRRKLIDWWLDHDRMFKNIAPEPPEFWVMTDDQRTNPSFRAELKAKYGYDNSYDWCVANWGSKWGDCDTRLTYPVEFNERSHPISAEMMKKAVETPTTGWLFRSPWGSATEVFVKVSRRFPSLVFGLTFVEESYDFAGWKVFGNGELLDEANVDMHPPGLGDELTEVNYDEWTNWQHQAELDLHDACWNTTKELASGGWYPLVEFTGD